MPEGVKWLAANPVLLRVLRQRVRHDGIGMPSPIPWSFLSMVTNSMCFAGRAFRTTACHSLMGRPYFFSIEGK